MRILFITERLPFPLHSGNAIVTWHTLDQLARVHDVDVFAYPSATKSTGGLDRKMRTIVFVESPGVRARRARQVLSLATRKGAIEALCQDSKYSAAVSRHLRREAYDVIIIDHLRMGWVVDAVRDASATTKVMFRSHNCESEVRRQYVHILANGLAWAPLKLEEWKTRAYEERVVRSVDGVIAITAHDAELHRQQGAARVFAVPPGFDWGGRMPQHKPEEAMAASLVLMGSFDYLAKELNALFLVNKVFPRVRARVPGAKLLLVGAGASVRLQRAARTTGGVTVTGRVPDAHAIARRCEVFIMPTVVGGGFELKGLEAIGLRIPIVATPLAVRGLQLEAGKSIRIGSTDEELATQVVTLLMDAHTRARQAESAYAEAAARYTWERAGAEFDSALRSTCGSGQ